MSLFNRRVPVEAPGQEPAITAIQFEDRLKAALFKSWDGRKDGMSEPVSRQLDTELTELLTVAPELGYSRRDLAGLSQKFNREWRKGRHDQG